MNNHLQFLQEKSGVDIANSSKNMGNMPRLIEQESKISSKQNIVDKYIVDAYTIHIVRRDNTYQYLATPLYDFDRNSYLFTELSNLVFKMRDRLGKKILKLEELINTLKSILLWHILEKEDLGVEPERIAELFIYKLIKLDKLMPLFLDESVNEIYMDQRNAELYLDHQIFGRCNTSILLSSDEINALITRVKLEHPVSITYNKPSLKVEVQTNNFHLRISIDFPPLSPRGPSFNIRKLKNNPLTLSDLIELGSLPSIIGAYLVEAVICRKNITIIGEPNAGKTTLANAIDLHTPKHWRKIVIEDAIESINQTSMGYKQTLIQVDSFESNRSVHTKTSEILKLLHRSPDWIYLGEIQSKEHTNAMFEALNAGLKGIQTAHSDSIQKLFRRWKNLHNIALTDFFSLEIIIVMEREITNSSRIIRRIKSIYEIQDDFNSTNTTDKFYTKIYDRSWDYNKIEEQIKKKSILRHTFDRIMKHKSSFDFGNHKHNKKE